MNRMLRVIIRGFKSGRLLWRSEYAIDNRELENHVAALGETHARAMVKGELGMVELEFPDFPENERFFRIGTEADGMVAPIDLLLLKKRKGRSDANKS